MAKDFLVFQHTPWEGPGKILVEVAYRHKLQLHIVKVWEQSIPEIASYDGLIVLGGSPNVDQEKQYPFLHDEKRAIRQAIKADMPYLGICLGHQLLADALEAKVGQNFKTSVGFINGYLTHDGRRHPVFKDMAATLSLFKWHGQAVLEPMPKHIEVLATSVDCQIEAIAFAGHPHIVGVQSDNHAAAPEDVSFWLEKDAKWLASLPAPLPDPARIIADAKIHARANREQFGLLFKNWLALQQRKQKLHTVKGKRAPNREKSF
jgi:GMP synthase-like glutamine amidotransferase